MLEKVPFDQRKKEMTFFFLGGTPMRLSLAKGCFWKGGKSERDFGKMKWHVKRHERMQFD